MGGFRSADRGGSQIATTHGLDFVFVAVRAAGQFSAVRAGLRLRFSGYKCG